MNRTRFSRTGMAPVRHDRLYLEIFLKRDKLKWSDTETHFNRIFPDRLKVEKSWSSII
jgi:hypothetical protein